jgi:Ca2+-binding EF-hand superfamily protein
MGRVLKTLQIEASEDEIDSLVRMMDTDNSGVIEFEEFANALSSQVIKNPFSDQFLNKKEL